MFKSCTIWGTPVHLKKKKWHLRKQCISTDHQTQFAKQLKSLSFCSCLQLTGYHSIPLEFSCKFKTGWVFCHPKITLTKIKMATFSAAQLSIRKIRTKVCHPFFVISQCSYGDNPNKWPLNIHRSRPRGYHKPLFQGKGWGEITLCNFHRFTPTDGTCELSCELLGLLALRRLLRIGDFTGVITVGTNMEPGVPGADTSSSSFHKAVKLKKL